MRIEEAQMIAAWINYKDWKVSIVPDEESFYLQVSFVADSNVTGEKAMPWKGRKWILSKHMTRSEVVQTAFLAIKTAEEHEMREQFKYKGVAIFGPHFDVDALVHLISTRHMSEDVRVDVTRVDHSWVTELA